MSVYFTTKHFRSFASFTLKSLFTSHHQMHYGYFHCCCVLRDELTQILQPFYSNGLQNCSSKENKLLIENVAKEYGLATTEIKKWIYRQNAKKRSSEKQQQFQLDKLGLIAVDITQIQPPSTVTPLNLERWKYYLKDCPLPDKEWVIDGIENGFSLYCEATNLKSAQRHMPSAYHNSHIIEEYLLEEIERGSISGPYLHIPYHNAHLNRYGIIPKSNGGWRLITDLSHPVGASVNSNISDENAHVSYTRITSAVEKIIRLGRGCQLSKFDLKRAYRMLAVKENERRLLVTKWKDLYYVDLSLPFGARSAPRTFTRFSDMLEWILQTHCGIKEIQHSSDDFLICEPKKVSDSGNTLPRVFPICEELGIDINQSKTEGPTTQMLYLGFILDTDDMKLRIPNEKLIKIYDQLEEWIGRGKGSQRSLKSLIGALYYISQVIPHSKPHIKEFVERIHSSEKPSETVELSEEDCDVLRWWFDTLNEWDGLSLNHQTDYRLFNI